MNANTEHRTSDSEHRSRTSTTFGESHRCRANTGNEDPEKLVILIEQGDGLNRARRLHERDPLNELHASLRLAEFLQADLEFVDEIFLRFRGLRLSVIQQRRGSRSQQLPAQMRPR